MPDKTQKPQASTQSFLHIDEIKSNTLVRDDGVYLAFVAVSSTNFALKSQEEQNALIAGYQNFLNALDFDIEILMQSRKMDISSYLQKMNLMMERQTNELLRVQTQEYIEFIGKLIENASIMNKSFYIVVSYMPNLIKEAASGGFFSFLRKNNPAAQNQATAEKLKEFQENRLHLDQRVNTVIGGLSGLGIKAIELQTEEIIELIYYSYNFDAGPMFDASRLAELKIEN